MPEKRSRINLAAVPDSIQIELCVCAIHRAAAALASPEGREAIEKGKQEYLRHLAEKKGATIER